MIRKAKARLKLSIDKDKTRTLKIENQYGKMCTFYVSESGVSNA